MSSALGLPNCLGMGLRKRLHVLLVASCLCFTGERAESGLQVKACALQHSAQAVALTAVSTHTT